MSRDQQHTLLCRVTPHFASLCAVGDDNVLFLLFLSSFHRYEITRATTPHALCDDIYKQPPTAVLDRFTAIPPTIRGALLDQPFEGRDNDSCVGVVMRRVKNKRDVA